MATVTENPLDSALASENHDNGVGSAENVQFEGSPAGDENENEEPVIDIMINNVVCTYSTRCHLNLKRIAMDGLNVEYHKQHGMLNMKIRNPSATASIWSSGKITCTGATSEEEAKIAARKFARTLQKLGYNVRFCNFRVVNVLGTCSLPFAINIIDFSREHKGNASYEPELHPGVTYKIVDPKASMKIFSTGSITVTAPCVANVQSAIEHIFPLVQVFQMKKASVDKTVVKKEVMFIKKHRKFVQPKQAVSQDLDEEDWNSDSSQDSYDSEDSQD